MFREGKVKDVDVKDFARIQAWFLAKKSKEEDSDSLPGKKQVN